MCRASDLLADALRQAGQQAHVLQSSDGWSLTVLARGGRVLALFPPDDDHSLYWRRRELDSPGSARSYFASPEFLSPGGHRTWLAPEVHLFYPGYPDLKTYMVPPQIDPGDYQVSASSGEMTLANRCRITHFPSSGEIEAAISKTITPSPAGYRQTSTLDLAWNGAAPVSLWDIIQVPAGGEAIVPTRAGRAEVTRYLGDVPPGAVRVESACVRVSTGGSGIWKVGVPAAPALGIIGYRWSEGAADCLLVVRFEIDPEGQYVDVPPHDQAASGCPIQICSVDYPSLGTFAELEWLFPAVGGADGRRMSAAACSVSGHRAPRPVISAICDELLTPPI